MGRNDRGVGESGDLREEVEMRGQGRSGVRGEGEGVAQGSKAAGRRRGDGGNGNWAKRQAGKGQNREEES